MNATVRARYLLMRVVHWSLVLSFAVAWLSADEWDDVHIWAGYAVAALIGFRVCWGIPGARMVARYLSDVSRGRQMRQLEHISVVRMVMFALVILLAGVSVTGLMLMTIPVTGPEWVEEAHEVLANALLVLVVLLIGSAVAAIGRPRPVSSSRR
jgi:cytochrome b